MTKEAKVACEKLLSEKIAELEEKLNETIKPHHFQNKKAVEMEINNIRERLITYKATLLEIGRQEITEE